jgi:hypothetical protein
VPRPLIPLAVKGIVTFSGESVAIVNDQIVGVGDVVDGHRVQAISEGKVLFLDPAGASRQAVLPGFGPASPPPAVTTR